MRGDLKALFDIYQESVNELSKILERIHYEVFINIYDRNTKDKDCQSIQTIVSHVIYSGYAYLDYILKNHNDLELKIAHSNLLYNKNNDAIMGLKKMMEVTELVFIQMDQTNMEFEQKKFRTKWGVLYNTEQLLEHAIVHVLRHKRQILNFLNT